MTKEQLESWRYALANFEPQTSGERLLAKIAYDAITELFFLKKDEEKWNESRSRK